MVGNPEFNKVWRAISILINTDLDMMELKEIADSASFTRFVTEVFKEKDLDTKREWFLQMSKELL